MKFKRILALILTLLLMLSLTACGMDEQTVTDVLDTASTILEEIPPEEQSVKSSEAVEKAEELPEETAQSEETGTQTINAKEAAALDEAGTYTTKEDVSLYLHLYGHLPDNFITKKEAKALGWPGGSLEPYAPGKCIGGDTFGNREGMLPEADGRTYTECDINTLGADSRGAERLVFSNDGLIYYTGDHYETFTLLYGEEDS